MQLCARVGSILCWLTIVNVACPECNAESRGSKPKSTSGVYGYVQVDTMNPQVGMEYVPNCNIIVRRTKDKKVIKRAKSNGDANFTITLPPGKYSVTASPPTGWAMSRTTVIVTVWKGFYTQVTISDW